MAVFSEKVETEEAGFSENEKTGKGAAEKHQDAYGSHYN